MPANATNKAVTWSSNNKAIATVNSKGLVTAVKKGTATITVTTKDGNKTATCTVTVKAKEVKVTGVKLDKETLTRQVGDSYQLKATVLPENATNKAVTWSSSNKAIATVNSKGLVTAKTVGTATITVTTKDQNKTATCTITVKAKPTNEKMVLTTAKAVGETIKLRIRAKEADRPNVWIDLNNNGTNDDGEDNVNIGNNKHYNLGAKTITIYGKVTHLVCSSNQLTQLDVSKNKALTELTCGLNELIQLDVSKNTALMLLDCMVNQLTKLDVSKNTALEYLNCDANQLTKLDVSKNTALEYLNCDANQLTKLDVSKNKALTVLKCGNNELTKLDVSKNKALTELECYINKLTQLDVTKNTALEYLDCQVNLNLSQLNVANGNNGNITELNATYCPKLTCIKVDKGFNPPSSWHKDDTASWRNDGSECP